MSPHFRFNVVLTIGRYAGAYLNEKPLPIEEARKLANDGCQRGRPEVRFDHAATEQELWSGVKSRE